ncbi:MULTISPECIES: hypothetical protein [unclassified Paracoccus (in: a-proteobacteria)]|uniref:hypothetical protein n=1 Tax=unclassified Paracoccus (in: a-proteobacteria) TaxID=2688777 RepID=UPI0016025AF4|nr:MULTISPECIES: hypothetical protein [unclassified Paracoccus (in: a-proteobacteria)]MBB1493298.1 hypothetical protein [Paracoccus sp. MC1854]MBB1499757.1 hypothetical protein [Paracoccus sp. MC1862]QQO45763.1 hypothetical protein JGR78_05380 [Paracoccus sp. MC1862]
MQLQEIKAFSQSQEVGRIFELHDPVTGEPTGIRLRIVGPDSATQARARLAMADALAEAADAPGRVAAADRERIRLDALAACVLGLDTTEGGQPVPFTHAAVLRLLRAAPWVRDQVDAFA